MRAVLGLIFAVVAAALDLLINLLASAIAGDLGERLLVRSLWLLVALVIVGLVVGAWLGGSVAPQSTPRESSSSRFEATRLGAFWSTIRFRGEGSTRLRDLLLVRSTLDVDTRPRKDQDGQPDD